MDVKYADVIVQRFIEQAGGSDSVFLLRDGKQIPYAEVTLNEQSDPRQSV
jgi:glutathione synthase/RimK-type ligase-like ATP-grasp enzyme